MTGSLLLAWALVEVAALVALAVVRQVPYRDVHDGAPLLKSERRVLEEVLEGDTTWYTKPDAHLGWTSSAGASHGEYAQDAKGFRARQRPLAASGARLRVAAIGDSFTHGDEVGDDEVWTAVLEATRPELEVLNFGVSGYGLDQALLRYRQDVAAFSPQIVIAGVITDNVYRSVNVFRPFLAPGTGHVFSKPRFEMANGSLRLLRNPLRTTADYERLHSDPVSTLHDLAGRDYFAPSILSADDVPTLPSLRLFRVAQSILSDRTTADLLDGGILRTDTEAFAVTVAILEQLQREVEHDGAHLVVVLFPERQELEAASEGRAPAYVPLLEELQRHNFHVLDGLGAFRGPGGVTPPDAAFGGLHFSAEGNRRMASFIAGAMVEKWAAAGGRPRHTETQPSAWPPAGRN